MVLRKLFEDGNETSQKQLTSWAKAHRSSATSWLSSFKEAVVRRYETSHYQVKGQTAAYLLYLLVVVLVAGFGVIAFFNEAFIAGATVVGVAFVILINVALLEATHAGRCPAPRRVGGAEALS